MAEARQTNAIRQPQPNPARPSGLAARVCPRLLLLAVVGMLVAVPLRPLFVAGQQPVTVTYAAGWNLVAGPDGTQLTGVQGDLQILAPDGAGYQSADASAPLHGGNAYWAYFSTTTRIVLPSAPAQQQLSVPVTAGWSMVGNPSSQPLRLAGADDAYGFDPDQGYLPLTLLQPGRGALVLSTGVGLLSLTAAPDVIQSLAPAAPAAPAAAATPVDSGLSGTSIEVLASGFGQSKPGAPVTVAALIHNPGTSIDLALAILTVYDQSGAVIAAGDTTLHYLGAGETTGFAHRLTARGSGLAARVDVQIAGGKPASDPLSGSLSFSTNAIQPDRSGFQASAVLTSSYSFDLSEVRVDALAYDGQNRIIGGGETIKRLVPAGASVGVLVPLDLSGAPAHVDLYAHLP